MGKYGQQVESAVQNAANQGKAIYHGNRGKVNAKAINNNQQVKQAQEFAKSANFQKLLQQATKAINSQISRVGNKEVQKNLKALVNNANKQAKAELKKAGLQGNVMKKAQQKFNQNGGPQKLDDFKKNVWAQAKQAAAKI